MKFTNIFEIEYQKKFPFVRIAKRNLFYIFLESVFIAFVAFCLETLADYLSYDALLDRGFLTGPILIMYFFILFISLCIIKTPKLNLVNVLIFFFSIAIGICLIELIVGNVMEAIIHEQLWVYEGWLPLSWGYVSLPMGALWGAIGVVWLYVVVPIVHRFLKMIPDSAIIPIISIITTLVVADIIFSYALVIKRGHYKELYFQDRSHELSIAMINTVLYFICIYPIIYVIYDLALRRLKKYIYLPLVIVMLIASLIPMSYMISLIAHNPKGLIKAFAAMRFIPFYITYVCFFIAAAVETIFIIMKKRG